MKDGNCAHCMKYAVKNHTNLLNEWLMLIPHLYRELKHSLKKKPLPTLLPII